MTAPGEHTDLDLFQQIADGDENAFEQLYDRYLPLLYPVIIKIVRTEPVVKDLIQEVFLYLWVDREKLHDIESPKNWIFRIAYNRSYTWLKKHMAESRAIKLSEQNELELINETEDTVSFRESARLIKLAIEALPEQSKKIYLMSRQEGMKPSAIAEQLGMSVQVVKNSLYRSGKTIKDWLSTQGLIIPLIVIIGRL